MKALIVNDEHLTTELLRDKIDWSSLDIDEVFLAFSAAEAREILLAMTIDVILCDIEMPAEDGIQLIRWIKEKEIDAECILLTCHADFEYAQEALRLGCNDYLLLPARYPEITKSIKKNLNTRKERMASKEIEQYGKNWLNAQNEKARECGTKNTKESIVQRCVTYVQDNLASPTLTVNELATTLFLNRVYLNRIFREKMGVPLSQYIISERMKLAAHLLKDSELPMDAIGERVGYSSYSHFVSTFTKHYSCSPSCYRKSIKK